MVSPIAPLGDDSIRMAMFDAMAWRAERYRPLVAGLAAVAWSIAASGCGPKQRCSFRGLIEDHAGSGAENCGTRTPDGDEIDYQCVRRAFQNDGDWFRIWRRSSGADVAKAGTGDDVVLLYGRGGGNVDKSRCETPHIGREDVDPRAANEKRVKTVTCDLFSERKTVCKNGDRSN